MSDTADRIVLAIDGGGTTTRCLAIDSSGRIRGSAEGGPSNHILNPWETVKESIEKVICDALEDASIEAEAVECISLGTAGTGPDGMGKEPVEDLAREILPARHITATGDMVIAFHGAILEDCGVVANAGTGSVVYGRSPTGAYRQVGGWGHVLGDEGSAYDISVAGLRAAARCMDGRGESTTLVNVIPQALDVSDMIQVAFKVYGLNMSREEIAGLARDVARAAEDGDAVSRRILRIAAEELALAVTVALRELGLEDRRVLVSYIGSVFDSGELVIRPFAEAVTMEYPQATVLPPKFPAVIGAFIRGAKEAGWSVTPQLLMNIKESLLSR
jgi:N-acetylglucosamine kinase-like BadF-type ATPase